MGRGSAYSYDYFMLIDDEGWEEFESDDFNNFVIEIFNLDPTDDYPRRDSRYLGIDPESNFYVGLDWSGGLSCIFVERYTSDYYDEEVDGKLPDISNIVIDGFNKFLS